MMKWALTTAAVLVIPLSALNILLFFKAALPSVVEIEAETGMRFPSRPMLYLFTFVKEALAIAVAVGAVYYAHWRP